MPADPCRIAGVSYHLPSEVVHSTELERELGLREGSIERVTGIRTRHFATHEQPSQLGLAAAESCLAQAGVRAQELDGIIYAGVTRDFVEPATANIIQAGLGASRARYCFDVSNACLGFISALTVAQAMISAGRGERYLIVAAESGWDICEGWRRYRDRYPREQLFVLLTLGHAAAAMLIEPSAGRRDRQIMDVTFRSVGQHWPLCTWAGRPEPMLTCMEALQDTGLEIYIPTVRASMEKLGWTPADVDLIVPHQPARAAVEAGREALGFRDEQVCTTYAEWGNTGSVCLPGTLGRALAEKPEGWSGRVVLGGAGSGVNVGVVGVAW